MGGWGLRTATSILRQISGPPSVTGDDRDGLPRPPYSWPPLADDRSADGSLTFSAERVLLLLSRNADRAPGVRLNDKGPAAPGRTRMRSRSVSYVMGCARFPT